MLDLLIRGGEVIDGSGAPRQRADVGIDGEAIVAIGDLATTPARQFGLAGRGLQQPGAAADLVLFDARTITDRATFDAQTEAPAGIAWVLVIGHIAVQAGEVLDAHRGRPLRRRS